MKYRPEIDSLRAVAHPEAAFYLLPTRGWELLAGSLIAVLEAKGKRLKPDEFLSAVGLMLIVYSVLFFDENTPTPSLLTCVPVLGAVLIIMFARETTLAHRVLSSRVLVSIGLISYSVYLWHQPVFVFFRHSFGIELPAGLLFVLIPGIFLLSYFSWKFIEQPFRNTEIVPRKILLISFAVSSVVLFAFAVVGVRTTGFLNMYSPSDQRILASSINSTDYMLRFFNSRRLQYFESERPQRKILLIGDSFAQDLANAINETSLRDDIQLSTYRISGRCGNLYLDEDFTNHILKHHLATCIANGWYENTALQSLLREADEVWLASSWKRWNAELLPRSVDNIKTAFDVDVTVFGTKGFEDINLPSFLRLSEEDRQRHVTPIPERVISTNEILRAGLSESRFIDTSLLLCPEYVCPTLTPEGALITFDSAHLTQSGAQLLGRRLENIFVGADQ